jgi:uncharacterized protein YggU (UPF0235/DUF167 family)
MEKDGVVSFTVRVQPRASRDEILLRLLAASLKVPLSAVRIASGERSRTKRVEVRGVTAGAVLALAR